MAEYAVRAAGLVKRFGKTTALAGIDLSVRPGAVRGVLGPNGAGKTTAVRVLATLARPDEGTAMVGGFDVVRQAPQVRRLIGLTGQQASVDDELTGLGNLVLLGQLLDLRRADAHRRAVELLERFQLDDAAAQRVATYSGGMRRRLDLAASLIGRPRVIFLDEPSAGLDPISSRLLDDLIMELQQSTGATVVMVTHELPSIFTIATNSVYLDAASRTMIDYGDPAFLRDHREQPVVRQFLTRGDSTVSASANEQRQGNE
jgi:oleandomycin transport system ATP-binding protein